MSSYRLSGQILIPVEVEDGDRPVEKGAQQASRIGQVATTERTRWSSGARSSAAWRLTDVHGQVVHEILA
jgi:hypothetical protein